MFVTAGVAAALLGAAGCTSPISPVNGAALTIEDLRVGTGDVAGDGLVLTVNYTGWLYNPAKPGNKGAAFDASGSSPITFTLGAQSVIQGWDQGLVGMKVGGLRRLTIPPTLAYGDIRTGPVAPDTTLIFEIELLSAIDPNAPAATDTTTTTAAGRAR
jgi:FKBP-type peptidyl-prolyl cis-trans isomerase FkpA